MYNIPIDEQNYHANLLSKEELLWGQTTYERVLKRYDKLKEFVNKEMQPLCLSKQGVKQLLTSVTLAFCHVMKNSKQPTTQEQMDKTLKSWIYSFLPYIVQNLQSARYSHPVQFEPIALSCHYIIGVCKKAVYTSMRSPEAEKLGDLESFLLQEFSNLFRAISSSIALFSIGDDVHGVSIFRGVLEIFSKLVLSSKFPEEYVLFKNFNLYLQNKKQLGEPLPAEMTEYLKNEPLYIRDPESFLAYGWARNSKGNRIMSMKQLISNVITENTDDVETLLQLASEFTHEDYVGIGYDYISIRKAMLDYYYFLLKEFAREEELCEFVPLRLLKEIRHLQSLADTIYSGEFPLSGNKDR